MVGIGLAVVAAVAFGTLAISAKFAYAAGAEALPLLAARFALAALGLRIYHAAIGRPVAVPRHAFLRLTGTAGLLYAFEASLFFAALERAPAAVVGLVFYSYPLWTTVLALVSRLEPFRWTLLGALGIGSAGVVFVFSLPGGGLAGPVLALGAAVAVAVYFVFMQVALRDVEPSVAALWTSAGAAIILTVVNVVRGVGLPLEALPYVGTLALASAAAFVALYTAITKIGSSRAAVAAMMEPITTIVLAAIFLDEDITLRILIGAALVVSSLPVLAVSGVERRAPAPDAL